jgi:hypothetical protein
MAILITGSAVYERYLHPPTPKKTADEYFSFSDAVAFGENTTSSVSVLIEYVVFNITAVGGNATEVEIVPYEGQVKPDYYPLFTKLIQNQPTPLEDMIKYPNRVLSTKQEGKGWPLRFWINSWEAVGYVTVYVTTFYPFQPG